LVIDVLYFSLNGKIALCKCDLFFLRISILGNEITSIPGEHNVILFSFRSGGDLDHFVDVNKMVKTSPLNPWVEVHNATHIRGGVGFAAFEG
jgi:hypothetical protein